MGKQARVIYTDDLTGNEIPESDVVEATLRLDADEWKLVLTEDSYKDLRTGLERFTGSAMHRPLKSPKVAQAAAPTVPAAQEPGTEPVGAAPVAFADNATIRGWWGGLRKPDLKTLGIPAPPASGRGVIPNRVKEAHRVSTQRIPVDA